MTDSATHVGQDASIDINTNTNASINASTKAVLSVLGKDRKGIVARVATTLTQCEANIDDISQTILGEMFSMTMLVTLSETLVPFEAVQEHLREDATQLGVQITLQRQDVFDFMYKI